MGLFNNPNVLAAQLRGNKPDRSLRPVRHRTDCPSRSVLACRPARGLFLIWIALSFVFVCQQPLLSQTSVDGSALPEIFQNGVVQTKVRLWYPDADGRPVLVPDSTLDELFELRGERGSNASGIPNWSFGAIEVDVDVRDESSSVALVDATVAITLGSSPRPATVGLRLGTVLLNEQPKLSEQPKVGEQQKVGDALEQVAFQRSVDGYLWLLKGEPDSVHSIRLNGKSVITRDADRQSLVLSLPMSTCRIVVKLPKTATELRTRDSSDIVESEITDEGKLITITSSGGDVELSWLVDRPAARVAAIEASTVTKHSIRDPQQAWTSTTVLDLQWYGTEASNKISVALPAGARVRSSLVYDFEMFKISRTLVGEGVEAHDVLEIENYGIEQSPTLKLTFQWEWQPNVEASADKSEDFASTVRIAPIQVEGVDMHQGAIECLFQSQYSVTLDLSEEMSLKRQSRTEAGKMLGFEFNSQSASLRLTLRREQSLPIVRPTYHVKVDSNKLTLTGWLECSFDANQLTRSIGLDMPNWVLQENNARVVPTGDSDGDSGEALDVRLDPNAVGRYTLTGPDLTAPAFGGATRIEQTWRFVAQRDIDAGEGLEIQIPEIVRGRADGQQIVASGSGVLILSAADNILLRASPTVSLLEDSYSQQYQQFVTTGGTRTPLVYRFQPGVNTPFWAGTADRLPQQIAYEEDAIVNLLPDRIEVTQRFDLQIANSPLDRLRFAVPLEDSETVSNQSMIPLVYVDDMLVGTRLVDTTDSQKLSSGYGSSAGISYQLGLSSDSANGSNTSQRASGAQVSLWRVYELVAPPEMLGGRLLRIQTEAAWTAQSVEQAPEGSVAERFASSSRLMVPLAKVLLPSQAQRSRGVWTLNSSKGLTASTDAVFAIQPLSSSKIKGEAPKRVLPADAATLAISVTEQASTNSLRVEKVWLQTAITRVHRRDRFVAIVNVAAGQLRLALPKFIDDIRVFVDGIAREDYRYDYASDSLAVEIQAGESSEHIIEVTYFQQENLSWLRRLEMKSPRIEGTSGVGEFCWELLTPQTQHVAWCPVELTSNWSWAWSGFWWKRESPELKFDGALTETTQTRLPVSMNRYVMSGNRVHSDVGVWVLSRFSLWFPVGLAAILVAYSILNFQFFRRPLTMVGYAVVIASLALLWPDFAMLLGQTSVFALSLVGLVWVTQVAVDSRVRRRSVFNSRSISQQDSVRKYASSPAASPPPGDVPSTRSVGSSVAASEGR